MKKEINEFTQLFLIAGIYQYLQPKFYDLQRFEFVADWFCDALAEYPNYEKYNMKFLFDTYIIKK